MNIKEELAQKKFLAVQESIQHDISIRKKNIPDKLSRNGLLHSSVHVREILNLELEILQKLLHSKFKIDKDVFYKNSEPHTKEDENFLKQRISNFYEARSKGSIKSLADYTKQYRLPSMISQFNRESANILSDLMRKIEIEILENKISSLEAPEKDLDSIIEMEERRYQFLLKLYSLSEGDRNRILDMWKIGKKLLFSNSLTNKIGQYLLGEGFIKFRTDQGEISITHNGIKEIEKTLSILREMQSVKSLKAADLKKIDIDESKDLFKSFWNLLHPKIIEISKSRFETDHYADSVEAALKEVNNVVKSIVKQKTGNEFDGAKLMNRAFSLKDPIIILNDLNTQTGKDIQIGYMQIFSGVMTGIRNPKAHENIIIDKQRAIHFLFLSSLLMFKIDEMKNGIQS